MAQPSRRQHVPALEYRPDIDGLRAVAVLAVILFHFSPEQFPGGFIGVDIFFVISGYLITAILTRSFQAGRFSLVEFYQRRIRRLFPALALVLLSCLVVGYGVLFADEYKTLGKYIAAGTGFVENFALWLEADYFDSDAIYKPLLHLWSLSVEEQFYIVWPLILWALIRGRLPLLPGIVVIALMSFVLNLWWLPLDAAGTFYWPWTRAWELMAGAGLAMLPERTVRRTGHAQGQSLLGLGLLIVGFALVRAPAFPGFWALLPVAGTVLLIHAGTGAWVNRRMLAARPLVWLGLLSYPMYLWHWPLWSFYVTAWGKPHKLDRIGVQLAIFALVILLSWLTYRFVERPLRRPDKRLVASVLAALVALLGLMGLAIYLTDGHVNQVRQSPQMQRYLESAQRFDLPSSCQIRLDDDGLALAADGYCTLGDKQARTWLMAYGDSHAQAMLPALDRYGRQAGVRVIFTSEPACLSLLDHAYKGEGALGQSCRALGPAMARLAARQKPAGLVMIQAWNFYLDRRVDEASFARQLESTLQYYKRLAVPVLLLTDNPTQTLTPQTAIRFSHSDRQVNESAVSRSRHDKENHRANRVLQELAQTVPGAHLLKTDAALCDSQHCPWASRGQLLYTDENHLSPTGAMQVYPLLRRQLDRLLKIDDSEPVQE